MSAMYRRRSQRSARIRDVSAPRRGVYLVPNMITSIGLFCGVFSIVQTMQGEYMKAALAILAAELFDMLDGRVARMTNTSSRFGIEYDSLCDLVSFGVAPGLLIYSWALIPWAAWGWLAIAMYVICSALRLARFNTMVGVSSTGHFLGLPVPASAALLASIVLMYQYVGREGLPDKQVALLLVTYLMAVLMVSTVPYASFKNLKLHRRQPLWTLIIGILFLMVMIAEYQLVIFLSVSIYVASGPITWSWEELLGRRSKGRPVDQRDHGQGGDPEGRDDPGDEEGPLESSG